MREHRVIHAQALLKRVSKLFSLSRFPRIMAKDAEKPGAQGEGAVVEGLEVVVFGDGVAEGIDVLEEVEKFLHAVAF